MLLVIAKRVPFVSLLVRIIGNASAFSCTFLIIWLDILILHGLHCLHEGLVSVSQAGSNINRQPDDRTTSIFELKIVKTYRLFILSVSMKRIE